ncbi:hypothetical protein A3Q56_02791 [Intoshia linei]|uniref:Uncharacterized protein n=1 Tax=Intoshia linei TaxID=1819745 RepID=A0A177B5S2_9BILA|nr:hypothetical protein A3Q56_02791 [Intoshia linei]
MSEITTVHTSSRNYVLLTLTNTHIMLSLNGGRNWNTFKNDNFALAFNKNYKNIYIEQREYLKILIIYSNMAMIEYNYDKKISKCR